MSRRKEEPPPPPPEPVKKLVKVAIIGFGHVGTALGANLVKDGHTVTFGVRDPASETNAAKLAAAGVKEFSMTSIPDALAAADAVILALPGGYTAEKLEDIAATLGGPDGPTKNKLVVDASNPISPFPAMAWRWENGTSGAEELQKLLPRTLIGKAFNTVGAEQMEQPSGANFGPPGWIGGEKALTMLCCGHPDGKEMLEIVVAGTGFSPKYVGPIRYARNLEAIAELWIHLAVPPAGESRESWGRCFHFQVVTQKPADPPPPEPEPVVPVKGKK